MERRSRELEEKASLMAAEVEKLESMGGGGGGGGGESTVAASSAAGGGSGSLKPAVGMEARARLLESEKARLESEKLSLERQMRDMKLSLTSSEAGRKRLEGQLDSVGKQEGELSKERALRVEAEKKLAEAELRMKRLSAALEKSGTKLDLNIFADVRALMSFFEEQTERAARDAKKTDLTKRALEAKRKYLINKGGGSALDQDLPVEVFIEEILAEERAAEEKGVKATKGWGGKIAGGITSLFGGKNSSKNKEENDDDSGDGGGESEDESPKHTTSSSSSSSSGIAAPPLKPEATAGYATEDDQGPLPSGWVLQWDATDKWYSNAALGATSWLRPNADGSIPPQPAQQ